MVPSIGNNSIKNQPSIYTQLNVQTALLQTIQFSTRTQFTSVWPIHRSLSWATTLDQSRPGSDGKKRVLHIPQNSGITGALPSDCLMSYTGHSLWRGGGLLLLSRDVLGVFNSPIPVLVRVDLGVMTMKGYSTLLKAARIEPHHQIQFNVISRTFVLGCLTPLQICSWRILQLQSTGVKFFFYIWNNFFFI